MAGGKLAVMSVLVIVFALRTVEAIARGRNSTVEVNDHASKLPENAAVFRTLLESPAHRVDAVDDCVTRIKDMKLKRLEGQSGFSFPTADFIPPGAQAWCECLASNPPATGSFEALSTYNSYYDVPQGLKDAYDASFDYCRSQVLENSDYQTVDICRGMFSLFGSGMNYYQVSFCGRLCKEQPFRYDGSTIYYDRPELKFFYGCADECARDAMPGYCDSTLIGYSGTISVSSLRSPPIRRRLTVNSSFVQTQFLRNFGIAPLARETVSYVCGLITPYLTNGNGNECCNYAKAFDLFKPCCALNGDGLAEFDCDVIGTNELYDFCIAQAENSYEPEDYSSYCKEIFDFYAANPQYYGTAKAYINTNTKEVVAKFSDDMLAAFCSQSVGAEIGACDCQQTGQSPFVVNCRNGDQAEYGGPVTESVDRPDVPTPGAVDDPCLGLCEDGQDCVLAGNGAPFCAECSALVKPKANGSDASCCEYDADRRRCVTTLKNKMPGICSKSDDLFYTNDGGDRVPAVFDPSRDSAYACAAVRDMRQMGIACKVEQTSSGAYKCFE